MIDKILKLPRRMKFALILLLDTTLICIAFYMAFALRFGEVFPFDALVTNLVLLPILLLTGIGFSVFLGLPKVRLHAFEIQSTQRLALCALLLVVTAMASSYMLNLEAPRSAPIIFGMFFFAGAVVSRLLALHFFQNFGVHRIPVLIYGAGAAGTQLASALRQSSELKPMAFVDDNIQLQKILVAGLKVHSVANLQNVVKAKKIQTVLIAIPSISKVRRQDIVSRLGELNCDVQILPSYVELIESKSIVESLRPVTPEDLLGREPLDSIIPGVSDSYRDKTVLVSGAGGSIGSELCRQVLDFSPTKLVLFERSELALYQIEKELIPLAKANGTKLVPVLGCVTDAKIVNDCFSAHQVNVVLHAAAYKHVPLVEHNKVAGVKNNVLGTANMAELAAKHKVERFVLISTDKAVRPTNIMGATKRLAELVVQDMDSRGHATVFSMVRFGNVLGSSGSVVPLFKEQIAKGGPITLTHPDVTRFFMAISEAAHLVLIAGSLSAGGEVFVLDMGEPVKIKQLAEKMIELTGLSIKDDDNPNGDIEITIKGLRPGEKLYEELLIGADTLETPHPKILRAKEARLSQTDLLKCLKQAKKNVQNNDDAACKVLIEKWVEGYHQP